MRDSLPNLLIVGVSKAGTTSLFSLLSQHPRVCASEVKEPHYFSPLRLGDKPGMSLDDYAGLFRSCTDADYRMEATPVYFFGGAATVQAIEATLAAPRAIVSLRNPTERVWSNWRYKASRGATDETFEAFCDRCEAVLKGPVEQADRAGSLRALVTGRYIDFIDPWFELLGERFRVVVFDDMQQDPALVAAGLFRWLDLQEMEAGRLDTTVRNRTLQPRSRTLHRAGLALRRAAGERASNSAPARLAAGVYRSLNAGKSGPVLEPSMLRRLEGIFEEPNRELGQYLRSRGYQNLPAWLS